MLPILRSLYKVYGPISVIHFDAHLVGTFFDLTIRTFLQIRGLKDTWGYLGPATGQARITHGSFFYVARQEGLLSNTSIHAGIRCKLEVSISNIALSI